MTGALTRTEAVLHEVKPGAQLGRRAPRLPQLPPSLKIDQSISQFINMKINHLFGYDFIDASKEQLIDHLLSHINKSNQLASPVLSPAKTAARRARPSTGQSPLTIFTPNPEQLVMAAETPSFAAALAAAEMRLADGMGVVWASRFFARLGRGQPLAQRVTGVDVLLSLLTVQPALRVGVLGGQPELGQAVSQPSRQTVTLGANGQPANVGPVVTTWQWLPGYRDVRQPTAAEEAAVVRFLTEGQFEVLAVAFGAPWQEYWVLRHQAVLAAAGIKVVLVVGGAVDLLLQRVPRAPHWLRAGGGEWLFRLLQQPWRWRRQLRLIQFVGLTLRAARSG